VVDTLSDRYRRANKPVLFVEHDLDKPDEGQRRRQSLWYAARGRQGGASTPLIMVDSGYKYSEGAVAFERVYGQMVDAALERPPGVEVNAYFQRSGATVDVTAKVTNWGETALSGATLWAMVYEDRKILHTNRSVRAIVAGAIGGSLGYGQAGTYRLQFAPLSGITWNRAHVVVMVDQRAATGSGNDMLQAAFAVEGVPPTNTPRPASPTPVPTDPPTDTPVPPTAVPTEPIEPTPPDEPTAVPSTPPAEGLTIWLPAALRRWELP